MTHPLSTRKMNPFPMLSSGSELANLVVNSGLLHSSWLAISELYNGVTNFDDHTGLPYSLKYKVFRQPDNSTVVSFVTAPVCTQARGGEARLVSSATLSDTFPVFEFLCNKSHPFFSVDEATIDLFMSQHNALSLLKNEICSSTSLIITGHSLGGSIATLFTLWLLGSINLAERKRPLCITFGSPLLGDKNLQQAMQHLTWNSCFLHVISHLDPIPMFFISNQNPPQVGQDWQDSTYKPFGTFLLCSNTACVCVEDPVFTLELLSRMGLIENLQAVDYGYVLEHLYQKAILKDVTPWDGNLANASIIVKLLAIDPLQMQQQQPQINDINILLTKLEKGEEKLLMQKKAFNPSKKLSSVKVNMAYLEWYKKECKDLGIGYYDSFKNRRHTADQDVVLYKKTLTKYWTDLVEEAERKPQKEGATFRMRWLFGGTNYRRMVEPLDIATYYRSGCKDYLTQGRSRHYKQLEDLLNEEEKPTCLVNKSKKQNVAAILTEDSCFWAHVEEALISCKVLRSDESTLIEKDMSKKKLAEFEHYVLELMKSYAVSPEIFLDQSSFMQWSKEYKTIMGSSYNSDLTHIMKNDLHHLYARGELDFR